MKQSVPVARYSRLARWSHWLTFAFVALAYLLINLRGMAAKGSDERTLFMQSHILAGLAVLALVLPRLLHRLRNVPPPIVRRRPGGKPAFRDSPTSRCMPSSFCSHCWVC